MISGQFEPTSQRQMLMLGEPYLLRRHPVLIPVILMLSAVGLCIASFFADILFPVLALIGVPSALVCLSFALVLGVSGILTGIISIIEGIDRYRLRHSWQTAMFPKLKGA
ncbi:MAG: hypothetical protein NVS4B7_11170 [Ktedonobacteraceae bacterium]